MTVSAIAICQGDCVAATKNDETPMPKKNTSIIARRPQWSPSRPAGSDPIPNSTNAPAAKGIRSSQRPTPKSSAIALTAVAKTSSIRWSIAWATLRSRATAPVWLAWAAWASADGAAAGGGGMATLLYQGQVPGIDVYVNVMNTRPSG